MVRINITDHFDDQRFRLVIRFGHKIILALEFNANATLELVHQKLSGINGRLDNQLSHTHTFEAVSIFSAAALPPLSILTSPSSSHHSRVIPITAKGIQSS